MATDRRTVVMSSGSSHVSSPAATAPAPTSIRPMASLSLISISLFRLSYRHLSVRECRNLKSNREFQHEGLAVSEAALHCQHTVPADFQSGAHDGIPRIDGLHVCTEVY